MVNSEHWKHGKHRLRLAIIAYLFNSMREGDTIREVVDGILEDEYETMERLNSASMDEGILEEIAAHVLDERAGSDLLEACKDVAGSIQHLIEYVGKMIDERQAKAEEKAYV